MVLGLSSCIEPYEPKVEGQTAGLLVVDGFINSDGVSTIRLSRTAGLSQKVASQAETRAKMFIELANGPRYSLTETGTGTYTSGALHLPAGVLVRLRFTTATGREYASNQTTILLTPAIDSLTWRTRNDRLYVYANTHELGNQARYYRWSFGETWEFTSQFVSGLEYKNGRIVSRNENIYRCWASEAPTKIVLGNTLRLNQNIISEQIITQLPDTSVKLRTLYSTLVKQYALTAEEYTYWEALRKNTEIVGGLYDPLPTQLTGNVYCLTDDAEPVLGFVGAQSVQEKRLFISRSQLPPGWPYVTGYEKCVLYDIPTFPDPNPPTLEQIIDFFRQGPAIPVAPSLTGYYYSTAECVDCRKRGTNVKPSFWP
ncbi:DUF4249 domain-containing protein [Hymenobacter sp. BT728]|nr:DUF4249 domain-containing protein [Hymenobacter pini]